jgi:hypothetical protein
MVAFRRPFHSQYPPVSYTCCYAVAYCWLIVKVYIITSVRASVSSNFCSAISMLFLL